MRYYDLAAFLRTVSAVFGVEVPPRHLVDFDAAVAALRLGGGAPVSSKDEEDAALKASELFAAIIRMCPVLAGQNERVAARATADYLAARGMTLRLGERRLVNLAHLIEDDRLVRQPHFVT